MIIIGAGLAGLACALRLAESSSSGPGGKKIQVTVVEASDGVGGRVRTDVTDDGFLLDRGFHIFLTSYPACRELLDYDALDLQPFYAGADVFYDGEFHRVADPIRHLADGVATLTPLHPIGSIADKVKVGLLRFQTLLSSNDDIFRRIQELEAKKKELERQMMMNAAAANSSKQAAPASAVALLSAMVGHGEHA